MLLDNIPKEEVELDFKMDGLSTPWVWQPFTAFVRANAQAIIDNFHVVEVIAAAGVVHGEDAYFGEVYATGPGQHPYEVNNSRRTKVFVAEKIFIPEAGYWRYEFLAGKSLKIIADFQTLENRNTMLVRFTAENKSNITSDWVLSLFTKGDIENFDFKFDSNWHNVPPIGGDTDINGLKLFWGKPELADDTHYNLVFTDWAINPGETQTHFVLMGDIHDVEIDETHISDNAETITPVEQLAMQLKFNRVYDPQRLKTTCNVFTPGAMFREPYFWDAGFTAAGLCEVDSGLALECLEQYLPDTDKSLFDIACGSRTFVQAIAAWELFQITQNKDFLRKLYNPLLSAWRYCAGLETFSDGLLLDTTGDGLISPPGGGSGLDDSPSQIWTRGYGLNWARQEHYWVEPIEVNPTNKTIDAASVNMTSFAIRSAEILKKMADVLGIVADCECEGYIRRASGSLKDKCYNSSTGHYHWVSKDGRYKCPYYDLSGLTPLIAGNSIDCPYRQSMADTLMGMYMTEYGLTTVSPDTAFYRKGYWCGSIWPALHWPFFKAMLDLGRNDDAIKIATTILNTYLSSCDKNGLCFEKFDDNSGAGCGCYAFSGLSGIILNLWAALRKPGHISFGFDTIPREIKISENLLTASISVCTESNSRKCGLLIVLRPHCLYEINIDGNMQRRQTDEFGLLSIEMDALDYDKTNNLNISAVS